MKTLKDHLPSEFFGEFMDSVAARFLEVQVIRENRSKDLDTPWPGKQKNVHVWWLLADNVAVGWNENPNRGWTFPVIYL